MRLAPCDVLSHLNETMGPSSWLRTLCIVVIIRWALDMHHSSFRSLHNALRNGTIIRAIVTQYHTFTSICEGAVRGTQLHTTVFRRESLCVLTCGKCSWHFAWRSCWHFLGDSVGVLLGDTVGILLGICVGILLRDPVGISRGVSVVEHGPQVALAILQDWNKNQPMVTQWHSLHSIFAGKVLGSHIYIAVLWSAAICDNRSWNTVIHPKHITRWTPTIFTRFMTKFLLFVIHTYQTIFRTAQKTRKKECISICTISHVFCVCFSFKML